MRTYQGFDVLELNYDRVGRIEERYRRKFVLLDAKTGKRLADELAPAPAPSRPFTWTAIGLEETADLRAFLDARRGRAVPFWLHSYQWDLSLAEDLDQDSAIATIRWTRYAELMFGTTGGRRHIALWSPGSESFDLYHVTAATDPGDGLTETLTLSPTAARDYPADQTIVSFAKLCRLEDDQVEIRYFGARAAQATIAVRELPLEAPA